MERQGEHSSLYPPLSRLILLAPGSMPQMVRNDTSHSRSSKHTQLLLMCPGTQCAPPIAVERYTRYQRELHAVQYVGDPEAFP